ncbi:hypothetical protein [Mycolicibacterium llatzerense]|nr:hypothetical protein [Mycolicibacterium llatzerense]
MNNIASSLFCCHAAQSKSETSIPARTGVVTNTYGQMTSDKK